ncbi:uncharacterized protein SCHCODRAFT_02686817 [Schizophyllum commune H4-8]|uniref:uncharacterized protein n=1 Tax=Schizophyllum commune (strain H4-8 / FGSC 9210) TaxID=578458 RepID=UPI0021602AC3|nr:uncharacterized protein SCHCODRAFT_02686817 [Schizophyllum commune H4-8]KAI5895435.1 hypothetical protein SCHCODRAFT_02686817 [Schizophyllum commune H4-8]
MWIFQNPFKQSIKKLRKKYIKHARDLINDRFRRLLAHLHLSLYAARLRHEHGLYGFWNTVITMIVETRTDRLAFVLPQSKFHLLPKEVRLQMDQAAVKEDLKKFWKAALAWRDKQAQVSVHSCMNGDCLTDMIDEQDFMLDLDKEQLFDQSIRHTSSLPVAISDFAVVSLEFEAPPADAVQIRDACAKARAKYKRSASDPSRHRPIGLPEEFPKRYQVYDAAAEDSLEGSGGDHSNDENYLPESGSDSSRTRSWRAPSNSITSDNAPSLDILRGGLSSGIVQSFANAKADVLPPMSPREDHSGSVSGSNDPHDNPSPASPASAEPIMSSPISSQSDAGVHFASYSEETDISGSGGDHSSDLDWHSGQPGDSNSDTVDESSASNNLADQSMQSDAGQEPIPPSRSSNDSEDANRVRPEPENSQDEGAEHATDPSDKGEEQSGDANSMRLEPEHNQDEGTKHATDPSDKGEENTEDANRMRIEPENNQDEGAIHATDPSDKGEENLDLDWIGESIRQAGWSGEEGDQVCNLKQTFRQPEIKPEMRTTIMMVWEAKRFPSRDLSPAQFHCVFYQLLYLAMRGLILQILYVLMSEEYRHQDTVVGVVMVGDYWTWSQFRRAEIVNGTPLKDWREYTSDNIPIKHDSWPDAVQWGSEKSDAQLDKMMAAVNQKFPAATPLAVGRSRRNSI